MRRMCTTWVASRSTLLLLALAGCVASPSISAFSTTKQAARAACHTAGDCEIVPRSCCGQCGAATSDDMRAISVAAAERDRERRCHGSGCPDCAGATDPRIVAYCAEGACRAFDLSRSRLSACAADADCVAVDTSCDACDGPAWLAVHDGSEAALLRRLCPGRRRSTTVRPCTSDMLNVHVSLEPPRTSCRDGHCVTIESGPGGIAL